MCLSASAITLKNQPDAENSKHNIAKVYFAVLSEGLGSHTHIQRTFLMDVATALAGAQMLKVAHKKSKQKNQGYLPAKSCTKFASTWARKLISLHTYKRKRGEKLKAGGRILDCGVELGLMVRSVGCWSGSGTIRGPSVSTTSHLSKLRFFVDSIYLSYFLQPIKLYCYYLVGIHEHRTV